MFTKPVAEEYSINGMSAVHISNAGDFSVAKTFDCGQCFRFDALPDSKDKIVFSGVACGHYVQFVQDKSCIGEFEIIGATLDEYSMIWENYLSLDTDYTEIYDYIISKAAPGDELDVIKSAADAAAGIRILRQEPWEAVCSFIISQNNNIPRIKKIIAAMCKKYGEGFDVSGSTYYSFPEAKALAAAAEEEICTLRCGFRAGYIRDAAMKYSNNELDPEIINLAPDYETADKILRSVRGIGPKVSACALLFGYGRTEAFPVDVWIKRVIEKYFPDGLEYTKFGKYAGIIQQYLFYYERWLGGKGDTRLL